MTTLLRHDPSVLREEDGAVQFKILAPMFASRFTSSPHLLIRTLLSCLQRGSGPKKRFQYCLDPYSAETIQYLRAIQGHSGRKQKDSALQDNVLLPNHFAEYIYHVGSSHDMHSIIQPELIPGGKEIKKKRQTVFFTAVNPMHAHLHKQREYDVTKPRIAVHKRNWKIHQNTVYWAKLRVAQKKGLTFFQTRSKTIILHNTLPAACIEKVVAMNSGEVRKTKMYESPRSPRKVVLKPGWARRTNGYCKHWRESIQRPLAVKSSIGFKDYHTLQLKKKTMHAQKESKSWFINSKRTQIEKRWKPTWGKITRTTHSAKSRKTWSKEWRTWSTSKCVRSLLKFSAISV